MRVGMVSAIGLIMRHRVFSKNTLICDDVFSFYVDILFINWELGVQQMNFIYSFRLLYECNATVVS